jgi:predicted AAA+ superfamily ATPase
LDLDVLPTPLFVRDDLPVDPEADPNEPPPDHEEGEDYIKIDWHSKSGISKNIDLIKKEFEKERNLRPMKCFITGPPCSGKSHYAEKLAHHYNVPHIHMKQLLSELLAWDQEKEDRYSLAVTKRDTTLSTIRLKRDERLAFL